MKSKKYNNPQSRRKFILQTAIGGTCLVLTNPIKLLANQNLNIMNNNIQSKGYAGKDEQGKLALWNFEHRSVGDNDLLIDIKFSGICHSDIHTIKGHWEKQQYPQVPGHEIAGMVGTCGTAEKSSPTGITQGGYANNIIVTEYFAIKIPENMDLQYAAPLLCAGITTYSPLMKIKVKKGDKVGVVGIGGLGHMAIKLAVSKGAEVYAFTTSPSKVNDIKGFGAKEAIVVDSAEKLKPWFGKMDFMISTVPYAYDVSNYISCVKPYGYFTQVGLPINGELTINNFNMSFNRVNYNGSLIGGIPETQEILNYCAENKIYQQIQIIKAEEINEVWEKVVNKEARYRYVIDAETI